MLFEEIDQKGSRFIILEILLVFAAKSGDPVALVKKRAETVTEAAGKCGKNPFDNKFHKGVFDCDDLA